MIRTRVFNKMWTDELNKTTDDSCDRIITQTQLFWIQLNQLIFITHNNNKKKWKANWTQILASDGHTTSTQIENPMFSLQILFYSFSFGFCCWFVRSFDMCAFWLTLSERVCSRCAVAVRYYAHTEWMSHLVCGYWLLSFAFGHLFYAIFFVYTNT